MSEIKLYHGDCLVEMNKIDDKSVDMILCDLPYGKLKSKTIDWDNIIPFNKLWEQYNRIIKDNGAILLFGVEPFSSRLRMSNFEMYKYDLIWKKTSSGSFGNVKRMPMQYHENISVFYSKLPTYNPQFMEYSESTKKRFKEGELVNRNKQLKNPTLRMSDGLNLKSIQPISFKRGKYPESVLYFKSVPNCNGIRVHPTQKPTDLLEYLIKTYTNENDVVLDNCMGSGSTGVACINTDRDFIGIELDDNYFNIAEDRINRVKETIFDI